MVRIALLFAAALLVPAPADAAGTCKQLVVDEAGVLDVGAVTLAAEEVQNPSAVIRVRVHDSVPEGDLDARIAAERQTCPGWREADGSRRDDLIVLSVSIQDRRVGIYYGGVWENDLRDAWPGIQSDSMSPSFKQGRWTQGFVDGLHAVGREIDPTQHPTSDEGYADEPYGPGDLTVESGGSDSSGSGWVGLLVLGGILAVIIRFGTAFGRSGGSPGRDGGSSFGAGAFLVSRSGRNSGSSSHHSGGSTGSSGGGGSDDGGSSSF